MGESKNSNTLLPTLSVLVNNYNYARFIGEALEAILNQSYRPKEVIVVDDASTDNSVEIVQQYVKRDPIVHLIKNEKNMGIFYNISKFFSIASGEYVYLAGSDDRLLPGFFEKSMKLLSRYPEAGVCSSLVCKIDEEDRRKGLLVTPIISTKECFISPRRAILLVNKFDNYIAGQTAIYKRKALDSIGGFIPELNAANDAFALKIIVCKYGGCFIPEACVHMRVNITSYSVQINKDLNRLKKIWQTMEPLLTTTYKEYFTQRHIEYSRDMFSYIINSLTLYNLQNKEVDYIKDHIPPQKILERILFLLIKMGIKSQKILYNLYVFKHSKRRIWPVVYNNLFRSLQFHILYFISKMRRMVV